MNLHGKDIKVFAGNSNTELAEEIAAKIGLPLGASNVGRFSDGEIAITINEVVRGSDVFIIQSTCTPVNDNLVELLILIDAIRRASAGRITTLYIFRLCQTGQKGESERSYFSKACSQPYYNCWSKQSFNYGPACTTASRLL